MALSLTFALTAAASVTAIRGPQQKALSLRGGETSALTKTGAAIVAAHGATTFISPKKLLDFYGVTPSGDPLDLATLRNGGAWELGLASILMSDPEKVIGRSHYVAGLSLLAFAPYYAEVAGTPKEPYLFWIGLCAVLGTLAESGKISQWVAPALYGVNGIMMYASPQTQASIYSLPELSPLQVGEFRFIGQQLFATGAYLAALAAGKSQKEAFAAVFGVFALHCLRILIATKEVSFDQLPIIAELTLDVGLVVAALK